VPDRQPVTELGQYLHQLARAGWDDVLVLDPLCRFLEAFGGDELDVLGYIAERLRLGRGRYGPLDLSTDPRDWREEQAEEAADMLVYAACRALALEVAQVARGAGGLTLLRPEGAP